MGLGRCLLKTFEIADKLRADPNNKRFNLFDLYASIPLLISQSEKSIDNPKTELITDLIFQYEITAKNLRLYFDARIKARKAGISQKIHVSESYKPCLDVAIARYNFCVQCWIALPEAEQFAINHAELWLQCEINNCLILLRDAGFWGVPKVGSDSKTLGKAESIKKHQHIHSEAVKAIKNYGDFSQLQLDSSNPDESIDCLTCYIWAVAMNQAIDHKDEALMEVCKSWTSSELHYIGVVKNSPLMQLVYIRDGDLRRTGRSKKTYKPKPKIKRGRGRPPLGSK